MTDRPSRSVRDAMSMDVVSVVPEMTVRELMHTFLEARIRGAPVLDRAGKLLGVVSEDEAIRVALGHGSGDLDRVRVGDVMVRADDVVCPDEPLAALLGAFVRGGVRRALVVENDMLVGVVTPLDALRVLSGA